MIKGVTYILKNDANVQALVGLNKAGVKYKVFPVVCSQEEVPPYSVCRITNKSLSHKGASGSNRNSFTVDFMVSTYHKSYDECDALDNAIIQALVPTRGTYNGVNFQFVEFAGSSDDYVEVYGGLYVKNSTFTCMVKLDELT